MLARRSIGHGAGAGLCILLLVGCSEMAATDRSSFRSQYGNARTALEEGQFQRATKLYGGLLDTSGALEGRIRLEMAHAQLRAGDYGQAAGNAGKVAGMQTGTDRSAALSVQGTALHEIGLKQLSGGETAAGTQSLRAAQAALEEVLREDPQLDPLGGLAGRKASIDVRLGGQP